MGVDRTVVGQTPEEVLRAVLPSVIDRHIVNPSTDTIRTLVAILTDRDVSPVRLLGVGAALRPVRAEFSVASQAADLMAADRLEIRSGLDLPPPVVVTDDIVVALLTSRDRPAGLLTTDHRFVASTGGHDARLWAAAEAFPLRTPALSQIRSDLTETFGPDVTAGFDAAVAAMGGVEDDDLDRTSLITFDTRVSSIYSRT